MTELEAQFELAVREACTKAGNLGYFPSYFLQKMTRTGAVTYAKELVVSGELQTGLRRLAQLKALDLSIEHLVARVPRFASLFTKDQREAAEWRLKQIEALRR
ncbi:MAG TPA: hypothetical protein VGL83_21050 [Stellaceae bacterium]|jgi:hypothetical protein